MNLERTIRYCEGTRSLYLIGTFKRETGRYASQRIDGQGRLTISDVHQQFYDAETKPITKKEALRITREMQAKHNAWILGQIAGHGGDGLPLDEVK